MHFLYQQGLVQDFLLELAQLGYGLSGRKQSAAAVEEFYDWLSGRPLKPETMQQYYAYLSERPHKYRGGGLSSKTIDGYLGWLRLYFNFLLDRGLLSSHPMSQLLLPKPESKPREILSPEEVARLYRCATSLPNEYLLKAMLGVFYGCGLRRSEGERLDLRDVHFRSGLLYVRKGKGGRRRAVPMSEKVQQDLLRYAQGGRAVQIPGFFINQRGGRMRGLSFDRRLKVLLGKAKIEKQITLHGLRHSIATHLLDQGMALESVRDFLGHRHLETTQLYTRVSI